MVRIIPSIAYADAKKAIVWLCATFDFSEHLVHELENGKIAHAQLTYRGSMVMLGSVDSGSEYSKLVKTPEQVGGFVSQSTYIIVENKEIEAHFEKAKSNGAAILLPLKSEEHGGKSYTCKDPEGHIWNFGSYNPWREG